MRVCFCLLTVTHQLVVHIGEILPKPSFLQPEQSQHSQLLLIWQVLQSLNNLHGPLLNLLPCVCASLVVGSTELDTVIHDMIGNAFKVWK